MRSENKHIVSFWHDVPLCVLDNQGKHTGAFNFIFETPRNTKRKFIVKTKEGGNPIGQDSRLGKLREFPRNLWFNYGRFPRTWIDPGPHHPDLPKYGGNNELLSVIEVGSRQIPHGCVRPVKVLGVLPMVDRVSH